MKKLKIIFTLFLFALVFKGGAQLEVDAPAIDAAMVQSNLSLQRLNATSTSSNASIGFMKQATEKIDKIMEAASWAKNLKSIVKLAFLIENTICTYKNLSFWMNKGGGHNNCLLSFRYQLVLLNMQQAVDLINLALRDGFRMANEGRLITLDTATQKFEKSNEGAADLESTLKAKHTNSEYEKYLVQTATWKI